MSGTEFSSKTDYFSKLALSKLSLMRLLRENRLLKKTGVDKNDKDVWRNVSEHVLVQFAACVTLGKALGLSEESLTRFGDAAIIHDGDKKYQSNGLRAINSKVESGELNEKQAGKEKYDFFNASEEHAVRWMKTKGIPEEVINIASSDGHPALPRIMGSESSFEERLFHYVGSIVDQSNIVPLDQRIDALEKNSRYTMMNEYGRKVDWTGGRTLYEVQRDVGHKIESEIVGELLEKNDIAESVKGRLRKSATELPAVIQKWIEANYAK